MENGKFSRSFHDLTRFGVNDKDENDISRRIIFSNVIFISLPIVYFVFILIDFNSFLQPIGNLQFDQFIVPIVILYCFSCLLLNKYRLTLLSRLLFITAWPFLLHIIPIYLHHTPVDYQLAYPFGLVFHSMLIQLMFSHQKEKILFWGLMSINFIALMFVSDTLIFFMEEGILPGKLLLSEYYLLDAILYWLLFNLVMFYVIYIIENYIQRVNASKALIEEQRSKLNQLNQNLEGIVRQRTLELELQNSKLRNYAYYNAHLLRAPFCRIKGLVHLQGMINEKKGNKDQEIETKLNESVLEFEQVIQEIKEIVHFEGETAIIKNSNESIQYRNLPTF